MVLFHFNTNTKGDYKCKRLELLMLKSIFFVGNPNCIVCAIHECGTCTCVLYAGGIQWVHTLCICVTNISHTYTAITLHVVWCVSNASCLLPMHCYTACMLLKLSIKYDNACSTISMVTPIKFQNLLDVERFFFIALRYIWHSPA